MKGRDDRLKRLNPRRSINYLRQGLQHFWVRVGVVVVCIALALPQADGNRIRRARAAKGDFVLETLLLAQQRKDLVLKCAGVIRLHVREPDPSFAAQAEG